MTPSICYWVHPLLAEDVKTPEPDQARRLGNDASSTIFPPATVDALQAASAPAWVASGARYLEQAQAKWLTRADDPAGPVDAEAAAEALDYAARFLDEHVRTAGPDSPPATGRGA